MHGGPDLCQGSQRAHLHAKGQEAGILGYYNARAHTHPCTLNLGAEVAAFKISYTELFEQRNIATHGAQYQIMDSARSL